MAKPKTDSELVQDLKKWASEAGDDVLIGGRSMVRALFRTYDQHVTALKSKLPPEDREIGEIPTTRRSIR